MVKSHNLDDCLLFHGSRERITLRMPDNSVDLVIEDIPFGVRTESWDDKNYYQDNVASWLKEGMRITKHALIWFYASKMARPIFRALDMIDPDNKYHVRYHYWKKPLGSQYAGASNNNMFYTFEPIIMISKDWELTKSYGKDMPFGEDDLVYRTVPQSVTGHPTSKPPALMRKLIGHYSAMNEVIFDGFGGSFSTAIACIDMGRRVISVERSPLHDKEVNEDYKSENFNPDYFSRGLERVKKHLDAPRMFVGASDVNTEEYDNTIDMFGEEK